MSKLQLDTLWSGFHAATMVDGQYSEIHDAAVGVRDGHIAWIGPEADLPDYETQVRHDLNGGWVTPGLVDCHTHLVFGGSRANEFEMRLNGASYKEIAEAGGGIVSTVSATRRETEAQLYQSAQRRLRSLMADGVTTVEIKSGYGLDLDNELKMLSVARTLGQRHPVKVVTTCLAAHAVPAEYQGRADDYISYVCDEILPKAAERGLADAVDAFCESIAFSPDQVDTCFQKAQSLGLPVKLHAEQLSSLGGASLAARYHALSADHLEYMTEADAMAMAKSGTVAVLLPGAFYMLKETQKPPVEWLRKHKVSMAIATDANPGSSPALSLRLMMNMACTCFGLTPEEALVGATGNAAKALGLQDSHGTLEVGKVADFVCWDVGSPGELSYWLGGNLMKVRVQAGQMGE